MHKKLKTGSYVHLENYKQLVFSYNFKNINLCTQNDDDDDDDGAYYVVIKLLNLLFFCMFLSACNAISRYTGQKVYIVRELSYELPE